MGSTRFAGEEIGRLCEIFERDIERGVHHVSRRVRESEAGDELTSLGRIALPAIVAHLRTPDWQEDPDLQEAWGMLLYNIAIREHEEFVGPDFTDTKAWLAWADKTIMSAQAKV
ncbi:MAG: hypothetical protein WC802_00510 [Patescibacteria group bacterium]|jgi:hypothetical protein